MTGTLGSCGERTASKNQTSVDEVVRREDDATDGCKGETLMVGMKVAIQTVHANTNFVPLALMFLPLPLLVLVCCRRRSSSGDDGLSIFLGGRKLQTFLDWNSHVTTITSFATIPFVLTDATFSSNTGVLAPPARALTITALLALPASLATRLGRQVFLVSCKLMLEVHGRDRGLASRSRAYHPRGGGDGSRVSSVNSFLIAIGGRLRFARIGRSGSTLAILVRARRCRLGRTRFKRV